MQTGAFDCCAGKSSRMGDFKPMLQLGSISIAQRVINNFRQAGISKVVVVTGYKADVLERHLASNNVIFLRNEDYATTHMFDSVRIGLEYLKDKGWYSALYLWTFHCLQPGLSSVKSCADHPLVTPVCEGKTRSPDPAPFLTYWFHPEDDGSKGLEGAVDHCGTPMLFSECGGSRGIIHDADTPEDYAELLHAHNQSPDPFRNPHSAGSRKSILWWTALFASDADPWNRLCPRCLWAYAFPIPPAGIWSVHWNRNFTNHWSQQKPRAGKRKSQWTDTIRWRVSETICAFSEETRNCSEKKCWKLFQRIFNAWSLSDTTRKATISGWTFLLYRTDWPAFIHAWHLQAVLLHEELSDKISAIYCSPLSRAVDTASHIAPALPHLTVSELSERNLGSWDGLSFDKIRQNGRRFIRHVAKSGMSDSRSRDSSGIRYTLSQAISGFFILRTVILRLSLIRMWSLLFMDALSGNIWHTEVPASMRLLLSSEE